VREALAGVFDPSLGSGVDLFPGEEPSLAVHNGGAHVGAADISGEGVP
jgi:hypothetical protein